MGNPEMQPEAVRQASVAAEGMCLWVRAMELYNRIMKVVAPKKAALKKAESVVKVCIHISLLIRNHHKGSHPLN